MTDSPENLATTTPILFFTRWVTHFCAPVFMLTAGMGTWFQLPRGKAELTRFLITRGLWLMLLDAVALRFVATFSLTKGPLLLTVLWALGLSMIVLAGLIHLPFRIVTLLSVAMIVLHHLTDGVRDGWLWTFLHRPGPIAVGGTVVIPAYSLIPWCGVMGLGYSLGALYGLDSAQRKRRLLWIGGAMTASFAVLRFLNVYGDPRPWDGTFLSFLRVNKYPPSLDFILMTVGPALVLLAMWDEWKPSAANPFLVFGRTPLFYFLVHFLLIHLLAIPLALARYGHAGFLWEPMPALGGAREAYPAGFGYDLLVVYLLWMLVVVVMYPLCRWYAGLKARRKDLWLRYL